MPAAGAAPRTRTRTPIEHFVTLLQENHSFDNYFGSYPGADGIPADACVPKNPANPADGCVRPYAIGSRRNETLADNRNVFDAEYARGQLNGFVWAFRARGQASDIAMAHYEASDLAYYWDVAKQYVLFDRYFASTTGGTLSNHLEWMTATAGDPSEHVPAAGYGDLPTIFDRLSAKGVSWKVYVQSYEPSATFRRKGRQSAQVLRAPLLGFARYLDDPQLSSHIVPLDDYFSDLAEGTLPAVAYVVPAGPSEHPPGNVNNGQAFVRTLVTALKRSTAWDTSAFMWSYDDWGGWYDHVTPPRVQGTTLGFRVPALLVSPYARRGYIDSTQLDHTSVLKFVESNWNLRPLNARDAGANNFLTAFDFGQALRGPEWLPDEAPSPIVAKGELGIIYPAYGAAAVVGVTSIAVASMRSRRHRRHGDRSS
jgi:phospholipase C